MIILYIDKKQYLYEANELDKVIKRAEEEIKKGNAIQIIPA